MISLKASNLRQVPGVSPDILASRSLYSRTTSSRLPYDAGVLQLQPVLDETSTILQSFLDSISSHLAVGERLIRESPYQIWIDSAEQATGYGLSHLPVDYLLLSPFTNGSNRQALIQRLGHLIEELGDLLLLAQLNSRPLLASERLPETQPHIEALTWIETATGLSQLHVAQLLGVSRQTTSGWKRGNVISDGNRRRLLAVRDILKRASIRFTNATQVAAWLETPTGQDGLTPAELLQRGQLDEVRYLAVSSRSASVMEPPSWVQQPVAREFRRSVERREWPVVYDEPPTIDLESDACEVDSSEAGRS